MALQELNRAHIALRCVLELLGRGLHMEGQLTQRKLRDYTLEPPAQFYRQFHDTGVANTPFYCRLSINLTVPTHGPMRGGIPIERVCLRWPVALFVACFVTPTGQLKPSASCSAVAHAGRRRSFARRG